ncbi:hypothetical protein [Mesorhizobium sp. 113-3-3]|uniref:hypothetical protein n=1 Tax=Mesorhizobium sp. 113-3-3 TaxID=2744516 RepID=UPI001925BDBD|nr:hypothetical protein [Mesorhizobium sp. 113-3-3]BCG79912.1 hypothetical protein MesoLj113b_34540 [Mesorhizobium sp. 113-3-3]
MAITYMDQLKKLDEQQAKIEQERQKLQAAAHDEGMKAVNDAIAALNDLGYSYKVVETKGVHFVTPKKVKGSGAGTRAPSTGPCPICQFETNPHHDARKHRSQPEGQKKPFTAEELTTLGLVKV